MKVERSIQIALAALKRETDTKRQAELLVALQMLKDERIKELEHQNAELKLNKRYLKAR